MNYLKRLWQTLSTYNRWPITNQTPEQEKEEQRLKLLCSLVPEHPACRKRQSQQSVRPVENYWVD